jgi:hypothetical protein
MHNKDTFHVIQNTKLEHGEILAKPVQPPFELLDHDDLSYFTCHVLRCYEQNIVSVQNMLAQF